MSNSVCFHRPSHRTTEEDALILQSTTLPFIDDPTPENTKDAEVSSSVRFADDLNLQNGYTVESYRDLIRGDILIQKLLARDPNIGMSLYPPPISKFTYVTQVLP